MAEVVCGRCGHPNSSASNYCSSCGFDLHRAHEEPTTEHVIVNVDETDDSHDDDPGASSSGPAGSVDAPSESTPASTSTSGAFTATFIVKRGAKAGARYPVTTDITDIGRHPESHIFLDDVTVSRRHAQVRRDGDAVFLSDAGSLNGTYLNRTRIESSSLRSGDEVQIGKFKLVYLTGES